jgi:hypothetical protein
MRILGDPNLVKNFDKVPATICLKMGIVFILELSSLGK